MFNLHNASDDVEERKHTLQERKDFSPCAFPSSSKHVCDIKADVVEVHAMEYIELK